MENTNNFTEEQRNKYYVYLDNLRKSAVTNMYGAVPYLQKEFPELSKQDATTILRDWMNSFNERHP